jgi:transposase
MDRSDLQHLSKEQLIELVLQLQRPDKNSRTSSKPPSTDKKEKRENSRPGGAKLGHERHNRRLADDPDEFRDHTPSVCEQCGGAFASDAARELIGEYDEIEIPPVKPYVIRHRRFACRCALCGVEAKAPAPIVATTTPFGPRIHALAIYLKGFQALSYERLRGLFRDAFGLDVSEGALMNMFIRSHPRFEIEAEKAKAIVRAAQVVASDETGVRIEGTNSYPWVFHCKDAVVHKPDYSRAARVVDEMMAGHKPTVWISDRYSAQQKHGERHQTWGIKLVLLIWRATRPSRWSTARMICPSGLSFGLEKRSAWPRPSPTSPHQRWRGKSEIWKDSSKFFWPRQPGAIWRESCKQKSGARETSFSPFVTIPARSTSPTTPRSANSVPA